MQIFTDGSKSEQGVEAGIAIFIQSKLTQQLRYTLYNRCSKNQAEQLAIVKTLETIKKSQINDNVSKTVRVNTDSRITLQSLKNPRNHNYLTEEIEKKAIEFKKLSWTITFTWIKAHAGMYGKELADNLAKETARSDDISFNRIPKSEIVQQARDQSIAEWQTTYTMTAPNYRRRE